MRVLAVASEIYPLVKTGGLADVAGALPAALAPHGVEAATLVPGYPAVLGALQGAHEVARLALPGGGPEARLLRGGAAGLDLFVLDAPHLFDRPGGPYAAPGGGDWSDNALRFAALGWAAARIGRGEAGGWVPDIVHAHDWQAGLAPAYLHYAGGLRPATLMTVHNLAFQGQYPAELLPDLHLPARAYAVDGVEYYGAVGFLKAGLYCADRISTVSPSYAAEIATVAGGMGLGGLIAARRADLHGILNGIDTDVWDPARDPLLPARYDSGDLTGRDACRGALAHAFGVEARPDAPLFAMVGRLTEQKGVDLLLATLPALLATGGSLALLGSGDPAIEAGLRAAAEAHPGRIGVRIGYDEALAHLLQAGADVLIVPSRFEPCGLTQLCALRYGAVPLVARTGGLADTVIDANPVALAAGCATGLQSAPGDRDSLEAAIVRAATLFGDRAAWARVRANAMATDVSWSASAGLYARLYRDMLAAHRGG